MQTINLAEVEGHYPRIPPPPPLQRRTKVFVMAMLAPPTALFISIVHQKFDKFGMVDLVLVLTVTVGSAIAILSQRRKVYRSSIIVGLIPFFSALAGTIASYLIHSGRV